MLSINDYNHLKLLYGRFFKINKLLREYFTNNNWDNVEGILRQKDDLIRQIIFFEKPRKKEVIDNQELYKMKKNLIELEKENIVLVTKMQNEIRNEINAVSKSKKILNAYEPISNEIKDKLDINLEA